MRWRAPVWTHTIGTTVVLHDAPLWRDGEFVGMLGQIVPIAELSAERQADKERMITQCDEILRYVLGLMVQGTRPPDPIVNALRTDDWKFVLAQVERWKAILMRPPFGFTEEDLIIADEAARAVEAAQK